MKNVIEKYLEAKSDLNKLFGRSLMEPDFLLDEYFYLCGDEVWFQDKFWDVESDEAEYCEEIVGKITWAGEYVAMTIRDCCGRGDYDLIFKESNELGG